MHIRQMTTERVLAALFPQLSPEELKIMSAQEDLQNAVDNLKTVCGSISDQLEGIATKLHSHPATNNDAVLEGAVGELNTLASQLSTAAGDETSAEAGSVLDDSAGTSAQPAQDPGAGPTSSDPSAAPVSSDPSSTDATASAADPATLSDATTGEVIGTAVQDPAASDSPLPDANTDTTGASSAGGEADPGVAQSTSTAQ